MATIDELLQQATTVDGYGVATSLGTDRGMYSANEAEFDLRTMSPNMLVQKYGASAAGNMMNALQQGISIRQGDMNIRDNRTAGETAWDSVTGVGSGFAGGIGGLISLGAGLVHEDTGTWISDKIQQGTSWVEENQSDAVNAARRLQRAESAVDARDNTAQMEQEIAEGDSELVAGMRRWGRDLADTLGNSVTDPTMLTQGTSEAVGSLLAGGPISKGLKAIGAPIARAMRAGGPLTRNADRVIRAGDYAAWPAAIAGLEAGGAYTGTVAEIMEMTPEQLEATSPTYRKLILPVELGGSGMTHEDARTRIANNAGLMAAAIQAPIAGASGLLTRFAETPFRVPSFGSAARNVAINEPLEEAVQSTTGGLAQGLAVQQYADENRDLTEGLGEQTAQGALYGFTAAGTVQGPGMAVRTPGAILGATKRFIADRYNSAVEKAENESVVGDAAVFQASSEIRGNIAPITENLQAAVEASEAAPEEKAKDLAYISSLTNALSLTPEEAAAIPEALRDQIDTSGRIEAVRSAGALIGSLKGEPSKQMEAIALYANLLEPIRALQQVDAPILDNLPEGSPEAETVNNIRQLLVRANQSTKVRTVADDAGRLLSSEAVQQIIERFSTPESVATPEGQKAVQEVVAAITLNPTASTKAANDFIMKHFTGGQITLSERQQQALAASNAVIAAHDNFLAKQQAQGLTKAQDLVNGQIIGNEASSIKGKADRYRMSGRQYVNAILNNLQTGNIEFASELLEDLGLFAQHMQNKVDTLNAHYAEGSSQGNHRLDKFGYEALAPDSTRGWYQVQPNKGLYLAANNHTSVLQAQAINLEGQTIAQLYNDLRVALPMLTDADGKALAARTFVPLDPAIADGIAADVVARHKTPVAPQPKKETPSVQQEDPSPVQPTQSTESEAVEVPTQSEAQSEEGQPRTDEQAPQLTTVEIARDGVVFADLEPTQKKLVDGLLKKLPAPLQDIASKIAFVSQVITGRSVRATAYYDERAIGVSFHRYDDEGGILGSLTKEDRLRFVLSHELGHFADSDTGFVLSKQWDNQTGTVLFDEMKQFNAPGLEKLFKFVLDSSKPKRGREAIAQLLALYSHDKDLFNEHFPKTLGWLQAVSANNGRLGYVRDLLRGVEGVEQGVTGKGTESTGSSSVASTLGSTNWETPQSSTGSTGPVTLNAGQKKAAEEVTEFLGSNKQSHSIIGSAGTGKTTLINSILDKVKDRNVILTSPTHRANSVIRSKNQSKQVLTLHKLLGLKPTQDLEDFDDRRIEFQPGEDGAIPANSLIVVDESSMINDKLFNFIMSRLSESPGSQIIFMGDAAQLGPVKQNTDSKALDSTEGQSVLTEVMRARNPELLDESTHVRENGDFTNDVNLNNNNGVGFFNDYNVFLEKIKSAFTSNEAKKNPLLVRVVAATNAAVETYNQQIRAALFGDNAAPYVVGDYLMGYAAFGAADPEGDTPIANGVDYVVANTTPSTQRVLGVNLKSHKVSLKNVLTGKTKTVEILSPNNTQEDVDKLGAALADLIEQAKTNRSLWKQFFQVKESIVTPFPITNPKRKSNTLISKTIDYGYAHTIHKSQGGTYSYVFVDENSINKFPSKKDRERLRYVGLTRAEYGAFVLTSSPITYSKQEITSAPAEVVVAPVKNEKPVATEPVEVAVESPNSDPVLVEQPLPPTYETMRERFTSLWNATFNYILTKFRPGTDKDGNPISRLAGVRNVTGWVVNTLSDQGTLEEITGKKAKRQLTKEIFEAYEGLLDNTGKYQYTIGGLLRKLNDNLQKKLNDPKSQSWLNNNPQNTLTGKVLNLLEESIDEDGKVTRAYNPELIQSAALAAIQWVITNNRANQEMDDSEYERISGYENPNQAVKDFINKGLPKEVVIPAISSLVRQFWGLRPNKDADKSHADAVIDSVSAELLVAMSQLGFVNRNQDNVKNLDPTADVERTLVNYTINLHKISKDDLGYDMAEIKKFTDAIQTAVLTTPEPTRFIDGEIPPIAQTQMNNPSVKNTPAQKRVLEAVQAVEHRVNTIQLGYMNALGREGVAQAFGDGDPSWTEETSSVAHWESLVAKKLGIQNTFDELQTTVAEAENNASGKSLQDVALRFAYNFSKVGRLQMLGPYVSQASKLMREVVLPTWSNLDLVGNTKHMQAFYMAQMQHLDLKLDNKKVHQVNPDLIGSFIEGVYADPKMKPLLDFVREHKEAKPGSMDGWKLQSLMRDAGIAVSPGSFHAVVEWVRYQDANEAARKDFRTALYLEADGVTNGPMMAMLMLTTGKFTKHWVESVRKGGVTFGSNDPFHKAYSLDNVDLYKAAAVNMDAPYKAVRAQMEKQSNSKQLLEVVDSMNIVMDTLFGKDFSFDPETGTITFDRGFTKNPLTITLYGSGASGIAGNFMEALLDQLYVMNTKILNNQDVGLQNFEEFDKALQFIMANRLKYNSETKSYEISTSKTGIKFWEKDYVANKWDKINLRQNFLHVIVGPMRSAITATVGSGVVEGMALIQKATQVQSIFIQEMYRNEVEKLLAEKAKQPGYRKGDFLSQEELNEIDTKVVAKFPNITTRGQVFRVTKDAPVAWSSTGDYGMSLDGSIRVGPETRAPADAGVAGIASINIGFGDANVIQIAIGYPQMDGYLPVFDGWNAPLDKIEQQSELLNKAVSEAALGNPMEAIYKSFYEVMQNFPSVELSDDALASLARTAEVFEDFNASSFLAYLDYQLQEAVKEINARHKAMKAVGFGVDQMATASAPYYVGTPAEMTIDQATELLQAKFEEFLELEESPSDLIQAGRDARIFTWETLKHLVGELKMSAGQKLIHEQVLSAMGADGYTIVVGTRKQILQHMVDHGEDVSDFNEGTNGLIRNGKIYLANPTGETLTHELVHAATMQALIAHYSGMDLGPNASLIQEAITNLESMADEFMTMQVDHSLPLPVLRAMLHARNAMEEHKANGSMAGYVGEFIAWTTTNTALSKTLKNTPMQKIVHWAKSALNLIKSVLFGSKKMPKVGEDYLSNIQFNASILIQAQASISGVSNEITLKHATPGSRLENLRNTFQTHVTNNLKFNELGQPRRDSQQYTAMQELAEHAADLFELGHLEKSTLTEIMAALSTEASLDSQALIGVQEMYRLVQENLEPDSFVDPESLNLAEDTSKSLWKFQLVMGKRDRFYDTSKRSDLLPLFLGLSQVSPEFQEVLSKIKIPGKATGAKTVDEHLTQSTTNVFRSLSDRMTSQGKSRNVQQALDNMTNALTASIVQTKTTMDTVEARVDQGLRANEWVKNQLQTLSRAGVDYGTEMSENANNTLTRTLGKGIRLVSAMASEESADKVGDGLLQSAGMVELNNTFMSLAKDVIGRTSAIANIYDRIKTTRAMTQQMRQQFREHVPEVILKKFKNAPTAKQMATMYKGFAKGDLVALSNDTKELNTLITSQAARTKKIQELEASLQFQDKRRWPVLQKKMKQLAVFMHGGPTGNFLLRNAYAIANLLGMTEGLNRRAATPEMITDIDQLVSLYAFENLSKDEKDTLASLVQNEQEGVDFMLAYLVGQRKTEMARVKLGVAQPNYYKGYVPSLSENGGQVIVADDADFKDLKMKGYTRIGSFNGSNIVAGQTRGYYYSSLPRQAAFSQGMMQNINQTAGGVDRATGFSLSPMATRVIGKRSVRRMIPRMMVEKDSAENLMPIFGENGRIVALEQTMDPTMTSFVKPSTELHKMLGVWRGRQLEEIQAGKVNEALVDSLKTNYDDADDKSIYVNLLDPSVLDRVQWDAVRLFSDETREYAESVFGERRLMVRRDLVDDVIGYRNFSVSDFWTENNRLQTTTNEAIREALIGMFGTDIYKILLKGEQVIQGLVTDARTLIVVKSMLIPAINIASNMIQLVQRGVNPITMAKLMPKKLNELNTYVRTYLEQVELEAELRAATELTKITQIQSKIRSIKDAHRRLTIWPLIEAGEFSTIADIGNSRDDLQLSSGRVSDWLDNQIKKLPPEAQTLAKYGLVSKDTALFKGLQKSVQYGDFLAKAILYDHMLTKENRTREQALAQITEEFVNYDRLPGRMRGGLENLGLIWFYNFKLRSIKVGLSILRNNPLHALISTVIPTPFGIGTPVDENLIAKGFEGNLPYTIGPGMGFRAWLLNPWVNLVD